MTYLLIKALHLAAVITWIGGMLVLSLLLTSLSPTAGARSRDETRLINRARAWDGRVTTPAMLLVWILGLVMALDAKWFAAPWLWVKLIIVVMLSAVHGIQSGTLRRLANNRPQTPPAFLRFAAPLILAAITVIAILAIAKPL
ncbi:CopD family protein [Reyranella sp. CPCC 100927]|uniref:CopD family protein n=1 Tax=Reyranella sp. CPCC 100927 TaxID=2599616 RepID=UPI0015B46B00|nr:CopD family protein [Reyranella sp. CPCC 100927]